MMTGLQRRHNVLLIHRKNNQLVRIGSPCKKSCYQQDFNLQERIAWIQVILDASPACDNFNLKHLA